MFGDNVSKPEQKVKIKAFVVAPRAPGARFAERRRARYRRRLPRQGTLGHHAGQARSVRRVAAGLAVCIAGFGWTENFTVGTKVEGPATARAVSGDWYPLLFDGSYAAFDEWYWTDAALATPVTMRRRSGGPGPSSLLEPGYELLAGRIARRRRELLRRFRWAAVPGQFCFQPHRLRRELRRRGLDFEGLRARWRLRGLERGDARFRGGRGRSGAFDRSVAIRSRAPRERAALQVALFVLFLERSSCLAARSECCVRGMSVRREHQKSERVRRRGHLRPLSSRPSARVRPTRSIRK